MPLTALPYESVIDHLIFAAPDLDDGIREIEDRFGVRAEGGGQHVGLGTHNKLVALGPSTYPEIIAPDPAQPEPPGPRPYGVDGFGAGSWAGPSPLMTSTERSTEHARRVSIPAM
jgi:hypothetical protein